MAQQRWDGTGVPESTPAGFSVFLLGPVSSEISDLCEISDLILIANYFAS